MTITEGKIQRICHVNRRQISEGCVYKPRNATMMTRMGAESGDGFLFRVSRRNYSCWQCDCRLPGHGLWKNAHLFFQVAQIVIICYCIHRNQMETTASLSSSWLGLYSWDLPYHTLLYCVCVCKVKKAMKQTTVFHNVFVIIPINRWGKWLGDVQSPIKVEELRFKPSSQQYKVCF